MILSFGVFLAAVAACLIVGCPLVWALLLGLGLFFALGLRRGFSARVLAAMAWKQGREGRRLPGVTVDLCGDKYSPIHRS